MMRLPEFFAVIKEIKRIVKRNGTTIIYMFVEKPGTRNDLDVEIEPRKVFPIIVYPHKQHYLNNVFEGDPVTLCVCLNSKEYKTRPGWPNYALSMHLVNLKKILT